MKVTRKQIEKMLDDCIDVSYGPDGASEYFSHSQAIDKIMELLKSKPKPRLKRIKAWGHWYTEEGTNTQVMDISLWKSKILKEFPCTILIDPKYLKEK